MDRLEANGTSDLTGRRKERGGPLLIVATAATD